MIALSIFRKRNKNTQRQQQQLNALFSKRRKFHHVCILCIVPISFFGCAFKLNKNVYLMNFCVSRCFRYFVATASVFGRMLMNNQFGIQIVKNKKKLSNGNECVPKMLLEYSRFFQIAGVLCEFFDISTIWTANHSRSFT